jgi:hypothetical protein
VREKTDFEFAHSGSNEGEESMSSDQVAGVARAIISAVGGYFVGKGIIDASTATSLAGAGATIVVAIWSVVSKKPA